MPGIVAHLWIGADQVLRYAEEVGAISGQQAEEYHAFFEEVLMSEGGKQNQIVESERPTLRFLSVLLSLLKQDKARLLQKDGRGDEKKDFRFVGWEEGENIYLDPGAAYRAVALACRDSGEVFPIGQGRLVKHFQQEGLSRTNPGRPTLVIKVAEGSCRVLCLKRHMIKKVLEEDFPGSWASEQGEIEI